MITTKTGACGESANRGKWSSSVRLQQGLRGWKKITFFSQVNTREWVTLRSSTDTIIVLPYLLTYLLTAFSILPVTHNFTSEW